jgi:hypothetical protein
MNHSVVTLRATSGLATVLGMRVVDACVRLEAN